MELENVKGIGPARAKAYKKLGIDSAEALIAYAPRDYENRGFVSDIRSAPSYPKCSVIASVATAPRAARVGGGRHLVKFRIFDDSGSAEIAYFCRNIHAVPSFELGERYRFYGKFEAKYGKIECINPDVEKSAKNAPLPAFYPIYRTTKGLSSKVISSHVTSAFESIENTCSLFSEYLPEKLAKERRILPLAEMYRLLHTPRSREDIMAAQRSAAYREFFLFFSLNILSRRERLSVGKSPLGVKTPAEFIKSLPYKLTDGQISALREIKSDLNSDRLMRRIVIGDVGCGKTVVAETAALMVAKTGRLVALMAPTEILATQHFEEMSDIFEREGLKSALLLGSTPASERKKIKSCLSDGTSPEERLSLIVGTHALISESLEYPRLGLVIIDEQHRFGVAQRQKLVDKGNNVNSLSFSATPIPRSYAKMLYGDVESSLITDLPPNRRIPSTYIVTKKDENGLWSFIEKQIVAGDQAYVVCPMIEIPEEADEEEAKKLISLSVEERFKELTARFSNIKIGLLHGKMRPAEKNEVMQSFSSGETRILVTTTVVEVGVNVPNATVMAIIGADRFGLAQLHQLRGRISRSSKPCNCFLIPSAENEASIDRLKILKNNSSGFDIAEADLKLRGPGDLLSMTKGGNIRQSGELSFKYADFCPDDCIMKEAHADAESILREESSDFFIILKKKLIEYSKEALCE